MPHIPLRCTNCRKRFMRKRSVIGTSGNVFHNKACLEAWRERERQVKAFRKQLERGSFNGGVAKKETHSRHRRR